MLKQPVDGAPAPRTGRRLRWPLLFAAALALAGCAGGTQTPAGPNINNPPVGPGAVNNGVSIGPSEGVSTVPTPVH